ncbi:MAG: ankyrin repeat domain-containing protein [Spirochaetota bacterium]|nr:ankyrin repeat domain-containing protein [Spirochaetota bacterium]
MKKITYRFFRFSLVALFGLLATINIYSQESELISKASFGDFDEVKSLVESGVNIDAQDDSYGYTALMWACEHNFIDMTRYLLSKGADPNIRAKDGSTAIITAAGNAPDAVEPLLSAGADVNARADDGSGVLTECVFGVLYKGYPMGLAELLAAEVSDTDEALSSPDAIAGYTPLFWAARDNHEQLVRLLIGHGADVNAAAKDGKTPLKLAEEEGHQEMVKLLKSMGAR